MFGFFYYGIILTSKVIFAGKNFIYDVLSKDKAIKNNNYAYWRHDGIQYKTDTGKPIYYSTLRNGDSVIKSWNGEILQNFNEKERNRRISRYNSLNYSEMKLAGRYIDFFQSPKIDYIDGNFPKKACIFIDSKSHKYIKIYTSGICSQCAYMDLSSGEYVMTKELSIEDKKWLDLNNSNYRKGKRNCLKPATSIECMY